MQLSTLLEINANLKPQLTKEQWIEIIEYLWDKSKEFDDFVKEFYTEIMGFDYEDVYDLLLDIRYDYDGGLNRFIEDICNYCKGNAKE